MKEHQHIDLDDGRQLGYAMYGDPNGRPVIYCHGGQESRLSSRFMDKTARAMGIRLLAPERPGIGLSSPQSHRSFPDWSGDIETLADRLSIDQFQLFGLSGGAPHVLACTQHLGRRISKAAIVAGATPYQYKGSLRGMWFPVKLIHWLASMKSDRYLRKFIQFDFEELRDKPNKRLQQFQRYLPKPDKDLMNRSPEYGHEFIAGSLESYRQGIDGVVQEWQLYVAPWDIEWSKIESPIDLWYGEADKMAPKWRGLYYQEQLRNNRLQLLKNEGHFSLIRNHLETILSQLTI